jgi:hypothetical protein
MENDGSDIQTGERMLILRGITVSGRNMAE